MLVLISVDGMRPDGLIEASTPYLDQMIKEGALSLRAQSVIPSVTLPCHSTMLRGVDVTRHGVTTNVFTPLARPVESIFDTAKRHGLKTGFFYNWPELRDLAAPGSIDVSYCFNEIQHKNGDTRVAHVACEHIPHESFDFLMIYLGCVDQAGHDFGWMSDEYLEAIEHADKCIGQIIETCLAQKIPMNAIVTSDHGGHENTHGTDSVEDMTIPFLLWGYLIDPGTEIEGRVRLVDVPPTAAALLGIPCPRDWTGTAIMEAIIGTPESARHHHHHQTYAVDEST